MNNDNVVNSIKIDLTPSEKKINDDGTDTNSDSENNDKIEIEHIQQNNSIHTYKTTTETAEYSIFNIFNNQNTIFQQQEQQQQEQQQKKEKKEKRFQHCNDHVQYRHSKKRIPEVIAELELLELEQKELENQNLIDILVVKELLQQRILKKKVELQKLQQFIYLQRKKNSTKIKLDHQQIKQEKEKSEQSSPPPQQSPPRTLQIEQNEQDRIQREQNEKILLKVIGELKLLELELEQKELEENQILINISVDKELLQQNILKKKTEFKQLQQSINLSNQGCTINVDGNKKPNRPQQIKRSPNKKIPTKGEEAHKQRQLDRKQKKLEERQNKPIDVTCIIDIDKVLNGVDERSSLMIRNIPNRLNTSTLQSIVNENFKDQYDYLHIPLDKISGVSLGYAFINFINYQAVAQFYNEFNGKIWVTNKLQGNKTCMLNYSKVQGYSDLIQLGHNNVFIKDTTTTTSASASNNNNNNKQD